MSPIKYIDRFRVIELRGSGQDKRIVPDHLPVYDFLYEWTFRMDGHHAIFPIEQFHLFSAFSVGTFI